MYGFHCLILRFELPSTATDMAVIADRKGTARRMKRIVCDDADVFFSQELCCKAQLSVFGKSKEVYIYSRQMGTHTGRYSVEVHMKLLA